MTPERRTWLDSLKAGDAVAVDHHAGRYLGTVRDRTRGEAIEITRRVVVQAHGWKIRGCYVSYLGTAEILGPSA